MFVLCFSFGLLYNKAKEILLSWSLKLFNGFLLPYPNVFRTDIRISVFSGTERYISFSAIYHKDVSFTDYLLVFFVGLF